jgi:hypothetical protein
MYSTPGLARTARDYDLWNPGSMPIATVIDILAELNSRRPEEKATLGVIYRLAQQSTAGKRLTIAEMITRVEECVSAGLDGVILETNFCSEIESPADWLAILADLAPVVQAAHASARPGDTKEPTQR